MQLYVTLTSPYARLARILVIEKGLTQRVAIIEAKTRTVGSPYYAINPSGRVPYLINDAGVGMEDSQLICAYLDALDGAPRFHATALSSDWAYGRAEATRAACATVSRCGCVKCIAPKTSARPRFLPTKLPAASASPMSSKARWPRRYGRAPRLCRI